jgi:uncharacterized protein YdeI (YjbR/CyaY-like superfamily)
MHTNAAPFPRSEHKRGRFQRDAAARDTFQAAPPGYRKNVLHWITKAKREATRS